MRIFSTSLFALATALALPAVAQQAPYVVLVPGGEPTQQVQPQGQPGQMAQPDQTGQDRVIILTPEALAGLQQGQASMPPQSGAATAPFDIQGLAREIAERAYMQGRMDERASAGGMGAGGGDQMDPAAMQRIAEQLYERGYLQGRFEAQIIQAQGQQQVMQALQQARQALAENNIQQARQALDQAERALQPQGGGQQDGSQQGGGQTSPQGGGQQSGGQASPQDGGQQGGGAQPTSPGTDTSPGTGPQGGTSPETDTDQTEQ